MKLQALPEDLVGEGKWNRHEETPKKMKAKKPTRQCRSWLC